MCSACSAPFPPTLASMALPKGRPCSSKLHATVPAAVVFVAATLPTISASNIMEVQLPDPAVRLSDLPTEVVGIICRPLSLKDRVSLSITCRALLQRLASSQDAWGMLKFSSYRTHKRLPSILAWLAHRRDGLWRLDLEADGEEVPAAAQLAAALAGSPLVELCLGHLRLSQEGDAALQWLGSCTALTSLELTYCGLHHLPGALELLPVLADLSLAFNNLGGASWQQLRQLTALTRLDIRSCELDALPAELAELPAMAELSLSYNRKLGEASWERLQQLTVLTQLDISNCGLTALPAQLAALPALAALDLHYNSGLAGAAEGTWAPLAQCSSLTALGLNGIPFVQLPLALAALAPNLAAISFGHAVQEGQWAGGEAAAGPLFRLTGLTRLNLRSCLRNFPLPEGLSRLVALQVLDLGFSSGLEIGMSLQHLRHLTTLTRLNLYYCGLEDVPEELSHLQALKDLDFGGNASDPGVGFSWQRLSSLTALTRLSLDGCSLSRVPPELAELRSLAELSLCSNTLLGGWQDEKAAGDTAKWAALEQLTALTRLDASHCNLHAIPAALAALPRLQVLRLAYNRSLGRGGVEALRPLVAMTALQHLDLPDCNLPRELEVDAIPFPLHRLEGWAEPVKDLSDREIEKLRLG